MLIAAGVLAFAWAGPAGMTEAHAAGLRASVQSERSVFHEGDAVPIRLRIQNRSERAIAVLVPAAPAELAHPRSNVRLVLVSSAGSVAARSPPRQSKSSLQRAALRPAGGAWEMAVGAAELFGPLEADTYTVFVQYRASPGDFAGLADGRAARTENEWTGQIRSNHLKFTIVPDDPPATLRRFALEWVHDRDPGKRLRALWWLSDNALKAGMAEKAVRDLLGPPAAVRGSGAEWVYRVGRTGIHVTFDNGQVRRVERFET